jgi:cytoskeletal protein CcmA (bactofilin family)
MPTASGLGGTGVVEGDISHQTLAMEESARFEGASRRNEKAIDAQSFVHKKRTGDQDTKAGR